MIRRAASLVCALLAAGCAARGPAVTRPAAAIPRPPPREEALVYISLAPAALRAVFGPPVFVRKDGATEMWRYDGAACRAFFFLYGEKGAQAVRHVETLPRGAQGAADSACLTALRVSPAKTS